MLHVGVLLKYSLTIPCMHILKTQCCVFHQSDWHNPKAWKPAELSWDLGTPPWGVMSQPYWVIPVRPAHARPQTPRLVGNVSTASCKCHDPGHSALATGWKRRAGNLGARREPPHQKRPSGMLCGERGGRSHLYTVVWEALLDTLLVKRQREHSTEPCVPST